MAQKPQNKSALLELVALPFIWLAWIPKVLFNLPEVSAWDRFLKVISIIFQSLLLTLGLNAISLIVPNLPDAGKIALFIFSAYIFFSFLGIFAKRFHVGNSIDHKFAYACLVSKFLIVDPETGKPELIPRIYKKLPGRLILDTPGWTNVQLESIAGELESALKMPIGGIEPWIVEGEIKKGYNVIWYAPKDLPGMIPFMKTVYRDLPEPGYVKLGLSMKGWIQPHLTDMTHFLVFAQTGQGKSVELENILTQYYLTIPTATFLLIDFKSGETFQKFTGINNIVSITNCDAANDNEPYQKAISALQMATHIMRARHSELARNGKKTYYQYGLFPIIIMIEEMREFFRGWGDDVKVGKKKIASYPKQAAALVDGLTARGRSAGVHIFIGTQRFDASAGPPMIRENLPMKVGGKTGSKEGSKMIVNTEFLFRMPQIKGRMAFVDTDRGGGFVTMQVPFLDEGEATELMYKHEHSQLQKTYENLLWSTQNPKWFYGKDKKQNREIVTDLEF